jgi:thioredoxin 1
MPTGILFGTVGSYRVEVLTMTLQVTEQNFAETVRSGIVLLDFWASWCGPCRAFAPIFEAAAARHPGVTFAKIDTQAQPGLAAAFGIRAIPTLAILRDGVLLGQQAGVLSAAALDTLIERVSSLDMVEVKKNAKPMKEAV